MIYKRTFRISASHFNSQETYEAVWFAVVDELDRTTVTMSRTAFAKILKDSHGHNFKIDIEMRGDFRMRKGWLVDDVKLAEIVNAWDNMNISMHPDFLDKKLRATTENMAQILFDKLYEAQIYTGKVDIRIRVHETDDIYAEA